MHGPDVLPWFVEGSIVPVRYDLADHSRVEIDMAALKASHAASRAVDRERAIEDAEKRLRGSGQVESNPGSSAQRGGESTRGPDPGVLLIGDSDRDQIARVLSQHLADGRLTVVELEQRLGALYASQTRAQAAAVIAGLPALAAGPALPEWLSIDGEPVRGSARLR